MIPLRVSALNSLVKCPAFASLSMVADRTGSKAADSGTAAGRVCQIWHEKGEDALALSAALEQAIDEVDAHPKADWDDVAKWCGGYASDPRNRGALLPGSCERRVELTLGRFSLVGHVDQIRRGPHGGLTVWDIKSGKPGGRDMTFAYAWQVSAYALACTETLGEPVLPGGIIRLRSYAWNTRCKWDAEDLTTAPAFYAMPWDLAACREMLEGAEFLLGQLEEGIVLQHPGTHCQWCPGESPHLCGDRIADAFA